MIPFLNIHHHDNFSLRCALGDVTDVIKKAKQFNQETFAITNYNELSGWIKQYFECKKQNIKPILAVQMMVSNYRVNYKQDGKTIDNVQFLGANKTKTIQISQMSSIQKVAIGVNWHLLLYVKNEIGYYNVIKIHNDAQLHGVYEHPRATNKFLSEHGKGVICVVPSVNGQIINDIENDRQHFAIVKYRGYKKIFEEVYLELTIAEDDYYIEENNKVIQFAKKYNIPLVIGINSHYINAEDEQSLKALMSIKKGGDVRKQVNICPNMSYKSTEQVYQLFHKKFENDIFTLNIFEQALNNNKKLVDSIDDFEINTDIKMPKYPNAAQVLKEKAWEGLRNRGKADNPIYRQRLEYELDNVIKAGFADYFLFLYDVCKFCNTNGIARGVGRGCFTPNSKVLMADGNKKEIKDINIGDIVITANGNKQKVMNKYIYDIDEDICSVKLENGIIIKCTKDHKFLIRKKYKDSYEYIYQKAKHILGQYAVNASNNEQVYKVCEISVQHYNGAVIDLHVDNEYSYNIENIAVHNSGGGCIVLYALYIFDVDPVKYNLLFERFLDANRLFQIVNEGGKVTGGDLPDVDLDSSSKQSIMNYLRNQYGENNVCLIGNRTNFTAANLLQDLGRVYGIEQSQILQTTKSFSDLSKDDKDDLSKLSANQLQSKNHHIKKLFQKYPQLKHPFDKLRNLCVSYGVHASGVLVKDKSGEPLIDMIPVRMSKDGIVSCWMQGSQDRALGKVGQIKFDFLEIKAMNFINDIINMVNERYHYERTMQDYTSDGYLNDKSNFKVANSGDLLGVWQLDSSVAKGVIKDMGGLSNFNDISATNALMRPASLQNKFPKKFGDRKNGSQDYNVPDDLKYCMQKTYGLPIFQQHAFHVARALANFDKVQSYKFMKLLYKGKMTNDLIPYWKQKFLNGCKQKVKHEQYQICLDDGTKKTLPQYQIVKDINGKQLTIKQAIINNIQIDEKSL